MFLLNKESAIKSSPPLETTLLEFSSDVTVNKSKGPSNNIRTIPKMFQQLADATRADEATLVGLITEWDKMAVRDEVQHLPE